MAPDRQANRISAKDAASRWWPPSGASPPAATKIYAALRVAEAADYIAASKIDAGLTLCDRICAMTWNMTH